MLYQQFAQFGPEQLVGVGYDLSPHYRLNLEQYRRWHPASTLGDPGPTQGFNTGVVLYNLARMRESPEYNRLLSSEEVRRVMNKYGYTVSLGDQDWFTNIGFEAPHLFYRLPCQFNAQMSVQYWRLELSNSDPCCYYYFVKTTLGGGVREISLLPETFQYRP